MDSIYVNNDIIKSCHCQECVQDPGPVTGRASQDWGLPEFGLEGQGVAAQVRLDRRLVAPGGKGRERYIRPAFPSGSLPQRHATHLAVLRLPDSWLVS